MANNKYFIGFLVLVVLTASVYILLPDNVRLDVANTKTTFKIYENNSWILYGTEYTKIYNGTKLMLAEDRIVNYTVDLENNKSTIFRYAYFKGGIIAIDTYEFDGKTGDKQNVPMSHKIQVLNGSGKTLVYEVNDLFYSGETINNIISPQTFRKMRVEWEIGNYYSQIFKYSNKNVGKLTIKYHIDSDDFSKEVRLFDPDVTIMNVTLISPANGTSTSLSSQTFSANVNINSTLYLQNTSLYIWNESQYNMYYNTTGLVGFWRFDDNDARDYFGVNNGTNENGAYENTLGKIGGSAVFDGTNDYINCSNSSIFNILDTTGITLSAWIKAPAGVATGGIIAKKTSTTGYDFILSTGKARLALRGASTLDSGSALGNDLRDNLWHHVVGVGNTTRVDIYVDGIYIGGADGNWTAVNTITPLNIGAREAALFFNGSIDDARIYNRTLSATEISNLYNIEKIQFNQSSANYTQINTFNNQTGLVSWWKLDDNTSSSLIIDSTSINNGTMKGSTNNYTNEFSVTGKINGAINFDGVNDYVNTTLYINTSNALSVGFWFYPKQQVSIAMFGVYHALSSDIIISQRSTGKLRFQIGNGTSKILESVNNYNLNNWNYASATFNGTNASVYLNGVYQSSLTPDSVGGSYYKTIALATASATNTPADMGAFNGSIDDVRVYNYSLSVNEISDLYTSSIYYMNNSAISQNETFTYSVTGLTDGKKYWNVFGYDTTNKYGSWQSSNWELTENACTYTTGNWNILFSDYCNITTNTAASAGVNNITITGIGIFTTTANITGFKNVRFSGTAGQSTVRCLGGCFK